MKNESFVQKLLGDLWDRGTWYKYYWSDHADRANVSTHNNIITVWSPGTDIEDDLKFNLSDPDCVEKLREAVNKRISK